MSRSRARTRDVPEVDKASEEGALDMHSALTAAGVSIRERPINIRTPIPVMWEKEAEDVMNAYTKKQRDTAAKAVRADSNNPQGGVVIPDVRKVPNADKGWATDSWTQPSGLVTFTPLEDLDYMDQVEYDLDSEDEQFLEDHKGDMYKAKDGTEFRFNDKYLEALIDLLEKNSFKEHEYEQFFLPQDLDASHTNLDALDRASLADPDDVPCCVCNDREYQDDDQIILCDGCDLAIHQDCQGLKWIPAGTWLCDRCAYFKKIGKLPEKELLNSPILSPIKQSPKKRKLPGSEADEKIDFFKATPIKAGPAKGKGKGYLSPLRKSQEGTPNDPTVDRSLDKKTRERLIAYRKLFESVTCCLCHQNGGAMKKNQDDEWVHIICALWIPELDWTPDKPVVDTSKQKKARLDLECCICHQKGGCVQCTKGACRTSYHLPCAQLNGYHMLFESEKHVTYCEEHTITKQNEDREKSLTSGKARVQLGRFVDKTTRKEAAKRLGVKVPRTAFEEVSKYWKDKRYRYKKGKRPLIRRLLIETSEEKKRQQLLEPNSKKKNALTIEMSREDKYAEMRVLRTDLERARTIIDLMRKREKLKLERVHLVQKLLGQVEEDYSALTLNFRLPHDFMRENASMFKGTREEVTRASKHWKRVEEGRRLVIFPKNDDYAPSTTRSDFFAPRSRKRSRDLIGSDDDEKILVSNEEDEGEGEDSVAEVPVRKPPPQLRAEDAMDLDEEEKAPAGTRSRPSRTVARRLVLEPEKEEKEVKAMKEPKVKVVLVPDVEDVEEETRPRKGRGGKSVKEGKRSIFGQSVAQRLRSREQDKAEDEGEEEKDVLKSSRRATPFKRLVIAPAGALPKPVPPPATLPTTKPSSATRSNSTKPPPNKKRNVGAESYGSKKLDFWILR